jgi:hypothetical protein
MQVGHEDRGAWDWEDVPRQPLPKLVINDTQWRIFSEAGMDMRDFVLDRPVPTVANRKVEP